MMRVRTDKGVGVLAQAMSDGTTRGRMTPHVIVPGWPAIPYNPDTMPTVPDEPRRELDVEQWMSEHSTDETRARNSKRVAKFRREASTPSKLRADKLIGQHVADDAVISAKIYGGYVVEHQSVGWLEIVSPARARISAAQWPQRVDN